MSDIVVWFGEINTFFLVLAIAIACFVTLSCAKWWAKWWATKVPDTEVPDSESSDGVPDTEVPDSESSDGVPDTEVPDSESSDVLNVKNLFSELTTVTDWYQLGVYLGLQTHKLDKIQQDHAHQGNDRQMLVMLGLWLRRTQNATWDNVVSALEQMGVNRVADSIRQKHLRRANNCK